MRPNCLKSDARGYCINFALPRKTFAASAIFFLLLTCKVFGQTPGTGAISGVVYDPSNRVVANAEVLVVSEATRVSRSVMASSEGVFRVPLLLPGAYTVTVKAARFSESSSHSIKVTASETSSMNVSLTVAGERTSVQVKSDSEVAQLESSTLGDVVDETAIQSLPLASRNYTPDSRSGARSGCRSAKCRPTGAWNPETSPRTARRRLRTIFSSTVSMRTTSCRIQQTTQKALRSVQLFHRRTQSRSSEYRRRTSMQHTDAEQERTLISSAKVGQTSFMEAHGSFCATTSSTRTTSL